MMSVTDRMISRSSIDIGLGGITRPTATPTSAEPRSTPRLISQSWPVVTPIDVTAALASSEARITPLENALAPYARSAVTMLARNEKPGMRAIQVGVDIADAAHSSHLAPGRAPQRDHMTVTGDR